MSANPTSTYIIRLQNLPNEARAADIRRYFSGLNIPDGGVHVVGGEKGDAFINFNSDDDARQAMMKSGTIFGNPVRLFLSSRSEMQTVIAQARAKTSTNPSQFQMEPSSTAESNGANPIKYPTPNVLSSMISNFQPKSNQPSFDGNIHQNGTSIQQILAALNEKPSAQGQTFPFQLSTLNNPLQTFNNSLNPQYVNALNQQRAIAAAAALLFQQPQNATPYPNPFDLNSQLSSNSSMMTADDPYVRVRNVPIGYSYHNIKMLFSNYKLNLSDIKIINDENGQRTGEIVLRLHTNQDVADILARDGKIQCFNSMLDIKKIDEYTFASAVDSFIPAHAKKTPGAAMKNCIRVTGLPRKYERKDVKRFFAGCNITNRPGGIFIEADTINGPIFVEFETEIDADKAFFYNGEQMGSSTIEMYRMTKSEMENEINLLKRAPSDRQPRRPPLLLHEPSLNNNSKSSSPHFNTQGIGLINQSDQANICLRLKNIPYATTEQQIIDYFNSISTPIETCKILRDRFNRGAGEALVRFHDPQSCQIAYERKNRQIFHGRSLDLRPLSLQEFQTASLTPMGMNNNDLSGSNQQHFQQGPIKRMVPYYERPEDDRSRDKRPRWDGNNQNKDGFGYHRNSARMNKDHLGVDGKSSDESRSSNDRRSSTPPSSTLNSLPALPPELNEYIGRILFLSNVAYRATREEILEFLRPYSPIPDTLKIRCDANGKPTGLGVVACETVSDASRAVAELNNQSFMSRKISIQQR